jgi:hypothetical protein
MSMQTALELIRNPALLNVIVKSSVVLFGVLHNKLLQYSSLVRQFS